MDKKQDIKKKINNILEILSRLNLPHDFKIQIHPSFTFYDGFVHKPGFDGSIITLNYKNKPQDIISFQLYRKEISIKYIQRVGNDIPRTKDNRHVLLESLIFASIPILKSGYSFTCSKIPFLQERYDYLIANPAHKSGYSRDHLKKEIDLYNPIRDRYFTKDGVLNFAKERVRSILNNYNQARKTKSIVFPRISLFKKINHRKRKII